MLVIDFNSIKTAMLTQKDALFNKKWSAYILSPSKCTWISSTSTKIIHLYRYQAISSYLMA